MIKDGNYQAADPPQLCSAHGQALSSSGGIVSYRKYNNFKRLYGRLSIIVDDKGCVFTGSKKSFVCVGVLTKLVPPVVNSNKAWGCQFSLNHNTKN